jgi:hypothetical protein
LPQRGFATFAAATDAAFAAATDAETNLKKSYQ